MKLQNLALLAALALSTVRTQAAITIPGADGSDSALTITSNTVIDLSQAVTTNWNANNSANMGKGVYDSNMWAVVFKYTDVNIASNAIVTFSNHPTHAPVVWLVSGNVTVNGTLSLDGQPGQGVLTLPEGGPGGFRGGAGYYSSGAENAAGFGPGGGNSGNYYDSSGGAGSYATRGAANSGPTYGNPSLIPLIGGSGGGGSYPRYCASYSGGGGGGAILIAVANTITNNGEIRANGGNGTTCDNSGAGSGGGVRLVSSTLAGNGFVRCIGGGNIPGGLGRIRIERANNNNAITVTPDPSVINLNAGDTALIWPPTGSPQARIVSINNTNAPVDPRAAFGTTGADVVLPQNSSNIVQVLVETTNVEQASQVKVRGTPRSAGGYNEVDAAYSFTVSQNPLVLQWVALLPANVGYSSVQVHIIRP